MRGELMHNKSFDIQLGENVMVFKPKYTGIQNWTCDYKPKQFGHLDLITSGVIEITIDGKKYIARANDFLCIPKNKRYFFKVSGNYSYYSFFFEYSSSEENNALLFPITFTPSNVNYFLDKYILFVYLLYYIQLSLYHQ